MARNTLQLGSTGKDVRELQQYLNNNGANLDVDGIFGQKTLSAVNEVQRKNGLTVDGIVGDKTWMALTGSPTSGGITAPPAATPTATTAPIEAPTAKPLPTAPTYDTTTWGETDAGKEASDKYQAAQDAVDNHGDFQYGNQAQLDAIMQSILNRDQFSYNFNEYAFYQQYKDKYTKQGKMAMADVMGQAAAMTGGYGSSYAATAGSQAYQASLENLNDVIPELYQMAYDRYNQEGQDLMNQFGLLQSDRDRAYGEHTDKYNQLMDALGIARGDYYDGANLFQTEQSNKNNIAGKTFDDAMSIWEAENTNSWNEAEWNRDQTWRDEDIEHRDEREKVEDERWEKEFNAAYSSNSTGGSGGSGSGGSGSSGSKPTGNSGSGNGGSNKTSTAPQSVIDKAKGYTTEKGQADYLANEVNKGTITEDQAIDILNQHGVTDLVNRTWEVVDDGGINWFGVGIDANAKVSDGTKTYTLAELRKQLQKTMSYDEATKWIKQLQKKLGI
jgi:peptidoglycan hydrolase-like protein with peptidoglycan-binding domain